MVKKKKKKVPIWALYVVAVLAVAGLVFAALFIANGRKDYSAVWSEVRQLTKGRQETEKFLNLEVKAAKLSDEEKMVVEDFEKVVPEDRRMQEVLQSINNINDGKNEDIKKAVDEVALAYIGLHTLLLFERDMSVMYDGELSDEDLGALSKSDYSYLVGMAKDIGDYREKVKKFDANDGEFDKSYKALVDEGEKLQKKYEDVKFEDMIGRKREEVLAYYDRVDELNKILQEQK